MRLEDRVAIVTGGSRGIGRAIALGFAREGAHVVAASRDAQRCEQTAAEIRDLGVRALGVGVDVARRPEVEGMVKRTIAELGQIDILVSNAGMMIRHEFLDMPDEAWDRTLEVNLKGAFLCEQAVAREMARRGRGSIINISSNRAVLVDRHQSAYAASKAGVNALTRVMALELAPHGIRVNAIGPGSTLTDLNRARLANPAERARAVSYTLLRRVADPEDLVGAAVFLAGDESRMVTGQCLYVDGGSFVGIPHQAAEDR